MIFVLFFSKVIIFILRLFKIGGGTALPGILIEKISPKYITALSSQFQKIILITGTNGKTTTQTFLKSLFESCGLTVCSNTSGANIFRGIAARLVNEATIFGKIQKDIGIFEVEEATMPEITRFIHPHLIVVTNLFRDQLDAYGEIVQTRKYILQAIKNAPKATIILNGDDVNVYSLSSQIQNPIVYFTVEDKQKKEITFERAFLDITTKRPAGEYKAINIKVNKDLSTTFDIVSKNFTMKNVNFRSPGIHNVYNALAAVCVIFIIKTCNHKHIQNAFETYKVAFGRGEFVNIGKKTVRILLVKNPVGFTSTLKMLSHVKNVNLLIAINDNIADGRDVSWLWDSNIETLKHSHIGTIVASGVRAHDMYLRLKYANVTIKNVMCIPSLEKSLESIIDICNEGETVYILPTYTAMLKIRSILSKKTNLQKIWEES